MSYSPPPAYPSPFPPPPVPKRGNGLGLASLVVGIAAFVGAFVPFLNYVTGVIAFVGIVLGVVALFLAGRTKGAALAGVIVSVVALLASIILAVVYTFWLFGIGSHTITDEQLRDNAEVALVYQVDGTGSDATISYTTYADDIPGTRRLTNQSLPFEEDLSVKIGGQYTYDSYTLTVTNGASEGDVTCRILLDGTVLEEQTSSGPYSTASCTASATQVLG